MPVRHRAGAPKPPARDKPKTLDERLAAIESRLEDLGRLVCPVCAPAAVAAIHPDVVPTRAVSLADLEGGAELSAGAVAARLDRLTG